MKVQSRALRKYNNCCNVSRIFTSRCTQCYSCFWIVTFVSHTGNPGPDAVPRCICKTNCMQHILKALDNVQQSLYWLNHISRFRYSARLYFGGFVLTRSNRLRLSKTGQPSGDLRQGPTTLEKRFASAGE